MRVLVATDAHIFQTPDGACWCRSIYGYDFWKRYLDVFEDVRIVARLKSVESIEGKKLRVDGENVEVFGVPFYQGPKQLFKVYFKILNRLKSVDKDCGAAIIRIPSQTALMVRNRLRPSIPLACEVVANESDHVRESKWKPDHLLYVILEHKVKRVCSSANGVSYVTEKTIQKNFPSHARIHGETKEYFEASYSSVALNDDAYTGPRNYDRNDSLKLVMSDVAMNGYRKGEKTLIRAVKEARERGYEVSAVLIGDGSKRKEFEEYARELDIADHIQFTGLLTSGAEVREELQKNDIFVLPSQGEGIPRGILEAMALGMPVLSTPVGGIPEILDGQYLFDPLDSKGFANKICELMENKSELNRMSNENYNTSLKFANKLLQQRRNDFYAKLRALAK